MKHSFHSHGFLLFLVLLFLLSTYSTANARLLIPKQVEEKINVQGLPQMGPKIEIEQEDSSNLMGVEHCDEGDEECLKRRMIAEAHLDYIYTQHHKP